MPNHQRILVVRPDRIGDVVLSTPLIRALRERFPAAYLAAMVRPYTADILAGNPHLDEILIDDPAVEHGFWSQVAALRRRHIDTVLMLLPSERHSWMTLFAGVRTRIAVGGKLYHRLTFARTVSRRKYIPLRHEADYCLDLGRAIGVGGDGLGVEVFLSDEERALGASRLGQTTGALIGIHPGSGRSAPNWRVERYAELARRLLQHAGVHIVLTGSASERHFVSAFAGLDRSRVIDLVGKLTLRETMAVISRLSVLVSASTGTMHIAAAIDTPTVSMFCPLPACSPELWGPQGNRCAVVLPPDGYCGLRCPGDPHVCEFEDGITTDRIYEEVCKLIGPAVR